MVRILVTYILPLVLPTVLYFSWAVWVRNKIAANHARSDREEDAVTAEEVAAYDIKAPWFRLILAGVGLMTVGLLLSVLLGPKNPPESVYVPPRVENGKIIPGHYQQNPN